MKYLILTILLGTCCVCKNIIFPDQLQVLKAEYNSLKLKDEESNISNEMEKLKGRMKSNVKIELSPDLQDKIRGDLSKGMTQFTLKLDQTFEEQRGSVNENLVFSPLSLEMLLATILLASKGRTFDEVAAVLNLNPSGPLANHSEIFHHFFGENILETFDNPDAPASFDYIFGTGVFLTKDLEIGSAFKRLSERYYNADIFSVDYQQGTEAKNLINDWVSNTTEGFIKSILSDAPNPNTQAIIASTLYFQAEWETQFMQAEATMKKPFYVEQNETVEADIMLNGGEFSYYVDEDFGLQILELPYKDAELSMYVMLPKEKGASHLKELKKKLTYERIEDLIGKMKKGRCILGLPRLKVSSNLELRAALGAMGLESLFDPATADLSVMAPGREVNNTLSVDQLRNELDADPAAQQRPRIHFEKIMQRVEMTVNESGTKAAAVGVVFIDRITVPHSILVDHPFVFFIRHKSTKSILFYGTINKP